jgi:hypothetical protein
VKNRFQSLPFKFNLQRYSTGHAVYEQSYFDRFWEQGSHTNRFFMLLSKN